MKRFYFYSNREKDLFIWDEQQTHIGFRVELSGFEVSKALVCPQTPSANPNQRLKEWQREIVRNKLEKEREILLGKNINSSKGVRKLLEKSASSNIETVVDIEDLGVLLVATCDCRLGIVDAFDFRVLLKVHLDIKRIQQVLYSTSHRTIVVINHSNNIPLFLLDLERGSFEIEFVCNLIGHLGILVAGVLIESKGFLVTADETNCIKVWHLADRRCVQNLDLPTQHPLSSLHFQPGSFLLSFVSKKISQHELMIIDEVGGDNHQDGLLDIYVDSLKQTLSVFNAGCEFRIELNSGRIRRIKNYEPVMREKMASGNKGPHGGVDMTKRQVQYVSQAEKSHQKTKKKDSIKKSGLRKNKKLKRNRNRNKSQKKGSDPYSKQNNQNSFRFGSKASSQMLKDRHSQIKLEMNQDTKKRQMTKAFLKFQPMSIAELNANPRHAETQHQLTPRTGNSNESPALAKWRFKASCLRVINGGYHVTRGHYGGSAELCSFGFKKAKSLQPHPSNVRAVFFDDQHKLCVSASDNLLRVQKESSFEFMPLRSLRLVKFREPPQLFGLSVDLNLLLFVASPNQIFMIDYEFLRVFARIVMPGFAFQRKNEHVPVFKDNARLDTNGNQRRLSRLSISKNSDFSDLSVSEEESEILQTNHAPKFPFSNPRLTNKIIFCRLISKKGLIACAFADGTLICFEFIPMENHNGLNGSLKCPATTTIDLRPNEQLETGDLFNTSSRSSCFWLSTSQGRIFTFEPNSNYTDFPDKKPLTKKMSFNAFRQTNSKFDFSKPEGNGERIFHVMSKENKTARLFKKIKINNDFLRLSKPKPKSKETDHGNSVESVENVEKHNLFSSSVKFDLKNLNGQKVLYDDHSELKFPWTLKNWFKATSVRPEIIRTFSQEQDYFLIGENSTIIRIFNSNGELLCWLDLDHPLPLKWDLNISYFEFWKDHLNEALKVIMQLNFRIKHKRSRLRKMIGLRDALGAVRKKFKEHVKIQEKAQKTKVTDLPTPGRQKWAFVKKITRKGKFRKPVAVVKTPKAMDNDPSEEITERVNKSSICY